MNASRRDLTVPAAAVDLPSRGAHVQSADVVPAAQRPVDANGAVIPSLRRLRHRGRRRTSPSSVVRERFSGRSRWPVKPGGQGPQRSGAGGSIGWRR